jgi:hypothetical protein
MISNKEAEFILIKEGVLKLGLDMLYAARFVVMLYHPWTETDAFKLGLLDKDGKKIKEAETPEEKSAYTPFIRLAFNIKRLLEKFPGGKSKIASVAAAYMLLREEVERITGSSSTLDEVWKTVPEDTDHDTLVGGSKIIVESVPIKKFTRASEHRIKNDK